MKTLLSVPYYQNNQKKKSQNLNQTIMDSLLKINNNDFNRPTSNLDYILNLRIYYTSTPISFPLKPQNPDLKKLPMANTELRYL